MRIKIRGRSVTIHEILQKHKKSIINRSTTFTSNDRSNINIESNNSMTGDLEFIGPMVYKKLYQYTFFYSNYLVLFTMVPRNNRSILSSIYILLQVIAPSSS